MCLCNPAPLLVCKAKPCITKLHSCVSSATCTPICGGRPGSVLSWLRNASSPAAAPAWHHLQIAKPESLKFWTLSPQHPGNVAVLWAPKRCTECGSHAGDCIQAPTTGGRFWGQAVPLQPGPQAASMRDDPEALRLVLDGGLAVRPRGWACFCSHHSRQRPQGTTGRARRCQSCRSPRRTRRRCPPPQPHLQQQHMYHLDLWQSE